MDGIDSNFICSQNLSQRTNRNNEQNIIHVFSCVCMDVAKAIQPGAQCVEQIRFTFTSFKLATATKVSQKLV